MMYLIPQLNVALLDDALVLLSLTDTYIINKDTLTVQLIFLTTQTT
jgi:hypothetical protein